MGSTARNVCRQHALFGLAFAVASAVAGEVWAAPLKVACIGEQTTHSDLFPPNNREAQPVGNQEYPAILQSLLGTAYQVRNFGDCCASVTQGYPVTGETHPYVAGSLPGRGPGYSESLAFLPDVVVIGSWGRHDWGQDRPVAFDVAKFQADYDDLVQRYQKIASHPKIFASLPIPIPFGMDGPDNGTATSPVAAAVKAVASKYDLPVVDLFAAFLNHKELFRQPPAVDSEGEHLNEAGFQLVAQVVHAAMMAEADAGASQDAGAGPNDAASSGTGDSGDGGGRVSGGRDAGGDIPGLDATADTGSNSSGIGGGPDATLNASGGGFSSSAGACAMSRGDASRGDSPWLIGACLFSVARRRRGTVAPHSLRAGGLVVVLARAPILRRGGSGPAPERSREVGNVGVAQSRGDLLERQVR
jgi:hypothetical protein